MVRRNLAPDAFQEHLELAVGPDFYSWITHNAGRRAGEVVLAIRRPDGRLLLHTKPFYPPGTWRLPSGGIKPGEAPGAAARREIVEETGLPTGPPLLLGRLTYTVRCGGRPPVHFASDLFLAAATEGEPVNQDPEEQICGYRWVAVEELAAVAEQLRNLPAGWEAWGLFRAPAHLLVAAALGA